MYKEGSYAPITFFEQNVEARKALTQMIDGTLFPDNPAMIQVLYHDLLFGAGGSKPDNYFVLKDFGSYDHAQDLISTDYLNKDLWLKKAVTNTAVSGFFSTDRTIREYNETIWKLK